MILGMMQPYFFPYLGYWQLMNLADEYIIYDDVNFIKSGWIHRNHIKINGEAGWFALSIKNKSQNRKINEHVVCMDEESNKKLIDKVHNVYVKAPYYKDVIELFRDTVYCGKTNLAEYLAYGNRRVAEYLGITTPIYTCTELSLPHELTGQDRILDICKIRGADQYVNAIGGKELYDKKAFEEIGCSLSFLRMDSDITYPQGKGDFMPGLSILDVMMYNSQEEIAELLKRYTLEENV